MAIISMFHGIIISMYYFDNNKHHIPHVHVRCQNAEIVLSILDLTILDGFIPSNKLRLVNVWINLHKEELISNWELAIAGEQMLKIEPLIY